MRHSWSHDSEKRGRNVRGPPFLQRPRNPTPDPEPLNSDPTAGERISYHTEAFTFNSIPDSISFELER